MAGRLLCPSPAHASIAPIPVAAFRKGLNETGYVENKNVASSTTGWGPLRLFTGAGTGSPRFEDKASPFLIDLRRKGAEYCKTSPRT